MVGREEPSPPALLPLLRAAGFDVEQLDSPRPLLDRAAESRPAYVVIDLHRAEIRSVLEAVSRSLRRAGQPGRDRAASEQARQRFRKLTTRERQICDLLMAGLLNKQIAAELGLAESTVKVHRSKLMKKLEVSRAVALVRFLDAAGWRDP